MFTNSNQIQDKKKLFLKSFKKYAMVVCVESHWKFHDSVTFGQIVSRYFTLYSRGFERLLNAKQSPNVVMSVSRKVLFLFGKIWEVKFYQMPPCYYLKARFFFQVSQLKFFDLLYLQNFLPFVWPLFLSRQKQYLFL